MVSKKEAQEKAPQKQKQSRQPGIEGEMHPNPASKATEYKGSGKLKDKVAIITGGDSGIGRSVAIHFAKEGANVVIVYKDEHDDADETQRLVEQEGKKCLQIAGDISDAGFSTQIVEKVLSQFGKIDILVNNAGVQFPQKSIEDISNEQLETTFKTNIFSFFYLTKACLPHLKEGSAIVNSTSVTAYKGNDMLIDYSSTKGAIVTFTRSLALSLAKRKIRVNAVAPGPIWTPLIPSTFSEEKVEKFGKDVPLQRPGQPDEVAPSYVFLACEDASYITGQVLHPNGGTIVNG